MNSEHLKALGLEEGATDEEISARIGELNAQSATASNTEPEGEGTDEGQADGGNDDDQTPPGSAPVVVPQQKDGETATPETVTVDAAAWNETQAEIAKLREMRQKAEARENDEFIAAALKDGRISPASKADWRKALDGVHAAETRKTIESFPKGTINVEEVGHGHSGDEVQATEEAYPQEWGGFLALSGGKA